VSTAPREEGGIPRVRRGVTAPAGGRSAEEHWAGANEAKVEKLRGRSLRRLAGGQGLELRHSAYGYALIDSARKHVDGRSDLSLDEVEAWLQAKT
jgi:hypothetical protein